MDFAAAVGRLAELDHHGLHDTDFLLTWDRTDDEIAAVLAVADALRALRRANRSCRVFDSGLGVSLFRDNSTRTRFSYASACNLLGLEVQDLDEGSSQVAHGETVRETATMVSFMADVVGIRDDLYVGSRAPVHGRRRPASSPRATATGCSSSARWWSTCRATSTTPPSRWPTCCTSRTGSGASTRCAARGWR